MGLPADEVFPGATVYPDDPRYPTLVRGFNLRWVGAPAYVALCGDTKQVVEAVQKALDEGRRITFRGGGHCYENFVSENSGGVIIDLSPMGEVYGNPRAGWYCVEGGATLWNAYTRLEREYGVTIPAGSCYSVGAGGHVTAGGYGLLSRLYGLTVDHLGAVELVYVKGGKAASIVVSLDSQKAEERALLWAHQGGGGGNFGIVTKFWFKEPPQAPKYAELASVAWNWSELSKKDSFATLLTSYGNWLVENSQPGGPYSGLFSLLHLNANTGPSSQVTLTVQEVEPSGGVAEFLAAITDGLPAVAAPARASGHPHALAPSTSPEVLPWLYATQTLNGSGPNRRGKYKSAYMIESFPEDHVTAMWNALSTSQLPQSQSLLQIDSYGGQVNAVGPTETAVAQRSSVMKLQFQTYWHDPAQDDKNLDWIRDFYTAMYGAGGPIPDGTVDGCYVGYPDVDLADWQNLYYKENYEALQKVKKAWDPGNVFNHAQSIELPT